MNNYFVILAAGKSRRFHKKIPKQFYKYKNKEIIEHSIEKSVDSKLFKKIVVVSNNLNRFKKKKYPKIVKIIKGGKERSDSSLIGLKYIKKFKPTNVLIHDAARPNFTINLLRVLIDKLKKSKAVVPYVNSKDTIKYKSQNKFINLKRDKAILTQTPQAFKFKDLYNLSIKKKVDVTDEASLFINNNQKISFIKGENTNNKITYIDDIEFNKTLFGIGFDIHRLIKDKKLYLGGTRVPFHSGLQGHSDGDVILHAIIDAILGATQKKDIGTYFPSNKNKFKNIRSPKMLRPILESLYKKNFSINNLAKTKSS